MKYLEGKEKYLFSTGRIASANCGIIGLSPNLEISDGYDGGFDGTRNLTKEERVELANYMIEKWKEFGGRNER